MKDLLRFDTVVAFCALLVSVITATVLGFQTHVVEEQYAATIWPYVSVDTSQSEHEVDIGITNNGLGPALIGSAQLFVDGHAVAGWTTVADILTSDPAFRAIRGNKHLSASKTSVDGSTTLRPGQSLPLLILKVPPSVPRSVLYKHQLSMQLCYCSLNDRCWNLETVFGSGRTEHPERAPSCPSTASIQA